MPPPLELTIVLAATRDMGIGLHGSLPWTGLKKEMAYFARVTKRVPLPNASGPSARNAVIMGRRTWESIPPRFRPLAGRLNVVISRSAPPPPPTSSTAAGGEAGKGEMGEEGPVMVSSLEQALSFLRKRQEQEIGGGGGEGGGAGEGGLGRVFVIGGGQVYTSALALKETKRVLLTRVLTDFECDTFFPLVLGEAEGEEGEEGQAAVESGWRRSEKSALDEWAGEVVPEGVQEENGTRYEFQMWERGE
ncbi:dihydrofolate reductase [Cercophora scortea]|uniref:Dihydrofolate reductase n=1 Tax=Cercophora scortea TaxID=314031 RepID=A0AAE0IXL0_9PEZI|nr:dihydrofolate reductase [Cercophora scortea]